MAVFVSVVQSLLLLFIFGTSSAMSGSLPMLPAGDRASLSAVGVVRSAGQNGSTLCSGTLVARDLVITSAHCIKQNAGLLHNVEFIAGVNGARFVANSGSVEVLEHPVWRNTSGIGKYRYDVAIIHLSRPIAQGKVQPIRLFSSGKELPERGALVGYRGPKAVALHGRLDCTFSSLSNRGLFASNCPASGGNSGGAVLTRGDNGWELAGIIVASRRLTATAVVIELDDWLRTQVSDALLREAKWGADLK